MRTILQAAALICLVIAGFIGLGVIDLNDKTTADAILFAVGWGAWGGALFVASHLVGDWP